MANNKKFVVKNGLQTKNIDFVTPNEANTLALATQDTGTIAISGNSGHLLSISDNLQNTIYLTGRIVTTSLVDDRDVSVDGSKLDTIGAGSNVSTVAGATGNVSNAQLASGISSSGILTTANVSELTNLYYTNARVYSNVTQIGYATNSNVALKANIADLTTSNISEGSNLYFSNARVSTAVSSQTLSNATFSSDVNVRGELYVTGASGDEGGQINLQNPVTNSSISGQVVIDVYQNKLRIFEKTGTNRGAYIDLTTASTAVGSNLLGAGNGTITNVAGVSSGAVSNTQLATATLYSQTLTNATFSANVTADKFLSTNNGNGENFKVGDDAWIGDYNLANSIRIKGAQDPANAYINFGTGDGSTLGRAGTGPLTYTGAFTATGNVNTGNVSGTAGTFTLSRLGTVESGTWQGTSISTTYTDAKVTAVAGATGPISNAQLAAGISSSGVLNTANVSEGANLYYTNARAYANIVAAGFYDTVSNTAPIGATESGTTLTLSHLNSGVSATTYGGASSIPVFAVDATGHITSASNVTVTVANSNISGNIIASQLQPTGVTPSTYGGAAVQTIITVDPQGRITSASNVTSTVANSNITGNIIASQIQPTGVTAGTYGGVATVPVYTVDQQGRLTSAANATISIPSSAINTDVALGTQTSGAYIANLVAGTGVTLSGLGNEGTTPTISIGQAVGTNNNVTFANLTVTGNLVVQGNAVIFESNTLAILDPLIQVGKNPVGDAVDLGFFGHYIGGSPSTERHAGLFRDATDGQFKLFTNLDPEPATIVDTANATYQNANLVVNFVVGKVTDISNHTTASLSEGSNLYYTNARAYANIVAAGFYDTVSNTAPIGATESGTTLTLTHLNSGVSATTYGGAASVPVYTVNATGHITSASNVTISIPSSAINTDIALGTQTSGAYVANLVQGTGISLTGLNNEGATPTIALATSGVAAATYGNATIIPVIAVDTYGRITSASNVVSSVANSNIVGNIIPSQLQPTDVTASTYGGAAVQAVFTVDQQGRLTSASNVTSTVANSNITGNIIASQIQPTGVTASTYGGAAVQSVITIDQQGRITSASNVTSTVANTNITGNIIESQITSVNSSQITGDIALGTQTSGNYVANVVVGAGLTGGTAAGEGTNPSIALSTIAGLVATTYGADAVQPVITVDQYGRITSVANVTSTVANSNITGNIIASQLQPTGVTASTYGGVATVPVYTVDQQGRLTSAANATISIPSSAINTDVALGTQTSGNYVANVVVGAGLTGGLAAGEGTTPSIALPTTGVSATTYGNATIVPVITIDAYGRITSASNVTISASGGGSVTSVAGATGDVSNAQLAAGIANATIANLTISGNINIGTTTPVANVHVANGSISSAFFLSPVSIDRDYTIPTNYNAMTAGPVTIASSANVTIPDGSTWTVV